MLFVFAALNRLNTVEPSAASFAQRRTSSSPAFVLLAKRVDAAPTFTIAAAASEPTPITPAVAANASDETKPNFASTTKSPSFEILSIHDKENDDFR